MLEYSIPFDRILVPYKTLKPFICLESVKPIIIISKWDICNDKQNEYLKICELFENEIDNIIFYSAREHSNEMANMMYSCFKTNESINYSLLEAFQNKKTAEEILERK